MQYGTGVQKQINLRLNSFKNAFHENFHVITTIIQKQHTKKTHCNAEKNTAIQCVFQDYSGGVRVFSWTKYQS